jgi:thiamine pyrophosphate-dependent acetolactate synthase large subunit-like protein
MWWLPGYSRGVEYIFGLPSTTCLDLVDAIRRQDGMAVFKVRHEGAAALMASACAKLTGKAGVCLTVAGLGATNLITGLISHVRSESDSPSPVQSKLYIVLLD